MRTRSQRRSRRGHVCSPSPTSLDDGPGAPGSRAPRADGDPDTRRRSAVRRCDPSRRRRTRLPHDLRPEVALRARVDRSARRRRSRAAARRTAELLLAAGVRTRWSVRAVAGSTPLRPELGADRAHVRATRRATRSGRSGVSSAAPRWQSDAASCSRARARTWSRRTSARHRLLAPGGEASAEVVARLAAAGVIVRDIPKTGLVRASVGWWTSDGRPRTAGRRL